MALTEYKPGTTFPGVVGRTAEVSKPAWPEPNRAKEGAPNVLYIVLDDTGFVLAVPIQAIVGQFLATFAQFPPRQKPGSFTIDQALEKMQTSVSAS